MSKYTPGPWVFTPVRSGFCIESEHELIVDTQDFEGRYGAIDTEANARLIAAAPDLLEALKNLMLEIEWKAYGIKSPSQYETVAFLAARAVIAKAEGHTT